MTILSSRLFVFSLLFSLPCFAADCFTVDGKPTGFNKAGEEIVDGQFIVTVDLRKAAKDDLVWLLGSVSRDYLRGTQYPIVMGAENLFLVAEAQDDGRGLARPQLIERVNAQVSEIAARNGVIAVGCNGISHPANERR